MHDIAFDHIHDEIVVTSPLAQAILTFRGAANGEEAPLRIIQGSNTRIKGVGMVGKVSIDPVNNEILMATPNNEIIVFSREANGNVAPIRVLGGPDTQIAMPQQRTHPSMGTVGGGNVPKIGVDPIHNLLLVPNDRGDNGRNEVLIFDRTASGNTPPRAVIRGPVRMGNQFAVYAPKMRMVIYRRPNIEIWDIPLDGVSTKPPLKIYAPFPKGAGDGVALDPLHKEVLIATAAGNTVLTFSVPEVFD